jgi:hypothetical protein
MDDSKQIERDLDHFENNLNALKRDYDTFFSGTSKQPPFELRKKVETTIRRFSSNQTFSSAQRFRYNSLVARFNAFQDLWNKQMRMKEEGRSTSGSLITSKISTSNLQVDPREQKLRLLYQEYVSLREKNGEGRSNMDYKAFCNVIKKQQEQIINKYQCKDVDFFVRIESGQTKLKARPVK